MGIFYNKTTFKVHRDAQEIPVKANVVTSPVVASPSRQK